MKHIWLIGILALFALLSLVLAENGNGGSNSPPRPIDVDFYNDDSGFLKREVRKTYAEAA